MAAAVAAAGRSERRDADGRVTAHFWTLPLEEAALDTMLRDLFEDHWAQLTFGPMLQGGAYELRCPSAPRAVTTSGGYLTVHWGRGGHFHVCTGESSRDAALAAHRRPGRCELQRGLDKEGRPITWSLQIENGKGESTLAVYFPNPFLTEEDGLADTPDWSRLALWRHVLRTYAGEEPDGLDETGRGFR